MAQLGSHWTDFHEVWYSSTFWKSVEINQVLLKYCKNIGHFTWKPKCIYDKILLEWKCFRQNLYRKSTHILCSAIFSPENLAVYEIMWKEYGTARQTTDDNIIRRMCSARWINEATQNMKWLPFHCNNGCTNAPHCYVIGTLPVLFHYCHYYNPRVIPFRISIIYYLRPVLMSVCYPISVSVQQGYFHIYSSYIRQTFWMYFLFSITHWIQSHKCKVHGHNIHVRVNLSYKTSTPTKIRKISGCDSGIVDVFALLGCYAASIGSLLPTFREWPVVPISQGYPKGGTDRSQNSIKNYQHRQHNSQEERRLQTVWGFPSRYGQKPMRFSFRVSVVFAVFKPKKVLKIRSVTPEGLLRRRMTRSGEAKRVWNRWE